jgi:hypothetical protein
MRPATRRNDCGSARTCGKASAGAETLRLGFSSVAGFPAPGGGKASAGAETLRPRASATIEPATVRGGKASAGAETLRPKDFGPSTRLTNVARPAQGPRRCDGVGPRESVLGAVVARPAQGPRRCDLIKMGKLYGERVPLVMKLGAFKQECPTCRCKILPGEVCKCCAERVRAMRVEPSPRRMIPK